MQRFNFATLINLSDERPIATHLPFIVTQTEEGLFLNSHMTKTNPQWKTWIPVMLNDLYAIFWSIIRIKAVVAFKINIHDLQAKEKLSQNKTLIEKETIISSLKKGALESDR